ncbi:hypothetical protein ACFX2J_030711 [Malus domestica]
MSISFESFIYRVPASKASFIELQLQSFIYKASFESFIYRVLASKASFIELQLQSFIYKAPTSKASFTKAPASKLHFQSFTYKASVHGIQRPPSNNLHFGPYID